MPVIRARVAARLLVLPLTAGLLVSAPARSAVAETVPAPAPATGTALAPAPAAAPVPAAVPTPAQQRAAIKAAKKAKSIRFGKKILKAARSRIGKPYRYGATGPNAFDCSGLTGWAVRKAGKKLPRTSGAQAGAVKRVRHPRKGDLVFFTSGRRVYHVAVYAGNHRIVHASRPGTPVKTARIWSRSVFYGRVA